jgi:hypothetical protein
MVSAPGRNLLFIRSWKTSTILVSKCPFSAEEIAFATRFCDARSFDLAYYAGMDKTRANRYDILDEPRFFLGASALAGGSAKEFMNEYIFNIAPTTDDRPYFFHFLRLDKAMFLARTLGREWLPLVGTGYVMIAATLVQAVVASGAFILLPLLILRHTGSVSEKKVRQWRKILGTLLYFGCIGLAFMLFEMALLPRFTFILAHPVYSAVLVLSSMLVFAGLGSLCVRKLERRFSWFLDIAFAGILLWAGLMLLNGERLFAEAIVLPFWGRLVLTIASCGFLAFFLGWPFPAGLRFTASASPVLVPWAWGVNACASVVGAVLGKLLSISFGFQRTMVLACVLYLVAGAAFHGLLSSAERRP